MPGNQRSMIRRHVPSLRKAPSDSRLAADSAARGPRRQGSTGASVGVWDDRGR
jgi:hypothetical protein